MYNKYNLDTNCTCGCIFYNPISKKFLVVYEKYSRLYGFPKGKRKIFETHHDAGCREILEELNLSVHELLKSKSIKFKSTYLHNFKNFALYLEFYEVLNMNSFRDICINQTELIGVQWMEINILSFLTKKNKTNSSIYLSIKNLY